MDNQLDEEKKKSGDGRISLELSISRDEFSNYFRVLEEKFGEMECPLCKKTLWGLPPRDDSQEHPALITLPLPNSAGRGIWAYPIFCVECGYIATFAAHHVAQKIKEG